MNKLNFVVCTFILALSGCGTSPIYSTSNSRLDNKQPLGVPYYKSAVTKGILTLDHPKDSPLKASLDIIVRPQNKAYLYLQESPLFADVTDFKTTEFGLPSSSDSQSSQQVTTVLNDWGVVAGKLAEEIAYSFPIESKKPTMPKPDDCTILTAGSYEFYLSNSSFPAKTLNQSNEIGTVSLSVTIEGGGNTNETSDPQCSNVNSETNPQVQLDKAAQNNIATPFDGFCAFEPTPIKVSVRCNGNLVLPPKIVNSYSVSRVYNPQRNFLTNRHETYGFTNGVVTEIKLDSQSEIKGASDIVLALPKGILSVLPTPSTQTQTQVQTGGGKPDQTTKTTLITLSPPK